MNIPQLERRQNNTTRVYLNNCVIEYSYDEPIGFKFDRFPFWIVRTNQWTTTTGKHINALPGDKKDRVDGPTFKAIWRDATEGILKDMMGGDDPASDAMILARVEELMKGG